jgi:phosphate acetyltransferase
MDIFNKIYQQAKTNSKRIVLPEGQDSRIIKAAAQAVKSRIARIILLGEPDAILKQAKKSKLDIKGIELVDPQTDRRLDEYAQSFYNLRKHKGITTVDARSQICGDSVYFGAMMLRQGHADGFVAGAVRTTSDVARAILRCIEKDSRFITASGSFLLQIKDKYYGEAGLFMFADCAIVPLPSKEQLRDIALNTTEVWAKVVGKRPRLALLSFSSRGSSKHTLLNKIKQTTEMLKRARPDLIIDGELQADSAIEPSVAKIKVPQSPLKGRANILIFPNLEAGNIAYKLMQRLAKARIVGPIIQGVTKPCSDLSRGCSDQEILDAIAVTSVRAQ